MNVIHRGPDGVRPIRSYIDLSLAGSIIFGLFLLVMFIGHAGAISPTSWQWNFTNVTPGNNTPVTFSTDQNPEWTFGPGNTSNLQNPIFQFNETGTFDINFYALRGVSDDWENKSGYITIPCHESLIKTLNITYIDTGDEAHLPWQLFIFFLVFTIILFIYSIFLTQSAKITTIAATMMFFVLGYLSRAIGYYNIAVKAGESQFFIIPTVYTIHPPYLAFLLYGFGLASMINCYYVWFRMMKEKTDQPVRSDPRPRLPGYYNGR